MAMTQSQWMTSYNLLEEIGSELLLQRCLKLKTRYFGSRSKQLMGEFLNLKDPTEKTIDEMINGFYKASHHREFIRIMKLFIAGEVDSIHTASSLERFAERYKPACWRLVASYRYGQLRDFIEGFKANCMKELIQEQELSLSAPITSSKKYVQDEGFFLQKIGATLPMGEMGNGKEQRHSLFYEGR